MEFVNWAEGFKIGNEHVEFGSLTLQDGRTFDAVKFQFEDGGGVLHWGFSDSLVRSMLIGAIEGPLDADFIDYVFATSTKMECFF